MSLAIDRGELPAADKPTPDRLIRRDHGSRMRRVTVRLLYPRDSHRLIVNGGREDVDTHW